MNKWWQSFLKDGVEVLENLSAPVLIEMALRGGEGVLSDTGALVVKTGRFTGRAPKDKYVVKDGFSEVKIDWSKGLGSLTLDQFNKIREKIIEGFNTFDRPIYMVERSVGADSQFTLGLRILSSSATHALFAKNIFREKCQDPTLCEFTIFHSPDLILNPKDFGLRDSVVIAISFATKEILIAGTGYAGEMKKAVFTVMNSLLPEMGVLPVHSGANQDPNGKVSLFLGLSGTGKTTLSTDIGMTLIGDDELGVSQNGTFNIEGGCYAKTFGLTSKTEPQIYLAARRFGSILENVTLDDRRAPQFEDKSITENGRATYPLCFIDDASKTGIASTPNHIFFLSADAHGVLPAVSKLEPDQVMYYFLSGYTAKLAGTETGNTNVTATFSHCFGAPFMIRPPTDYALLLKKMVLDHSIEVWLINTGWFGGSYGVGKRFDLTITRGIIRAIQKGEIGKEFTKEQNFGLQIPKEINGIDSAMLDPRSHWKDKDAYDQAASTLKLLFEENYKSIENKT